MRILLPCCLWFALAAPAHAGMPSPLPSEIRTHEALSTWAAERLQTISFFIVGFFVAAFLFKLLWNEFQQAFPQLPRLTYCRSVAVVFLWGMLFIVVLTMISGARELMTPGAWVKQGFTYKLAEP